MSAKPSILDQHRESRSIRRIPPAAAPTAPNAPEPFKATPFPATSSAPMADNRLIVGPRVRLSGAKILDCDTLRVEGHVDAALESRVIEIAAGGSFNGSARVENADISGRFEGELQVTGRLKLRAGAQVHGHVRYGSLVVEADATLKGDVSPVSVPDNAIPLDRSPQAASITALLA
jgi:cytoskeletal protein CcmA (bactofilin family)